MVKLFIYTLLAIVTALVITFYLDLPNDPGYLLIAWRNYTFETSLFALFALLVIVFVVIKLLLMLISWVNPWHLVRYGRRYHEMRQSRSRSKTVEGLMHFVRSNWQSAYNMLTRSYRDDDATVINYLAAAYAAYAMDKKDLWVECLDKAAVKFPASLSTINSLRAELLLRSNNLEQSLAVLEQLKRTSINDNHLLGLLKEVYIKLEDWKQLEALLPSLEKNRVISEEELDRIEKRLLLEEISSLVDTIKKEDKATESQLAKIHGKWKKAPHKFKQDEKLVNYYVDLLLEVFDFKTAAREIETFLNKTWSDLLIEKYGTLDFKDAAQQLIHGEKWLTERPNNSSLLLALGRICMRNKLWGKAREYFEASMRISASAEVYGELSRLTKGLGDYEASEKYFTFYTQLTEQGLPDLPTPELVEKQAS